MHILLLLTNTVCYAGQSATGKLYAARGGSANSFNICKAVSAVFLFLLWLLLQGQGVHWGTAPLAVIYGVCLSISMYAGFMAMSCGPMALTSIIAAMSLLIPFVWGIVFWQDRLTLWGIGGILLIMSAILLIHFKKENRLSLKWLLYSLTTMVTNGFCSVIQKYHQLSYPGQYQVDFMLFAMVIVTVVLVIAIPFQKEKKLRFSALGACSGVLNGLANFIVLLLAANQAATKLFPVVSASNIIAAWICGILIFRDRIQKQQLLGLLCGIAGIVLLQL